MAVSAEHYDADVHLQYGAQLLQVCCIRPTTVLDV